MAAYTYDALLSFCGRDTLEFTGNLHKALSDRGIRTFIDDDDLPEGQEIKSALLKAIRDSRTAIVVLSHNYVSSSSCLDQLETIVHCCTEGMLPYVLPVFYNVDPSEVRHGKALTKLQKSFKDKKKLQKWMMALRGVARFAGFIIEVGYTTLPIFFT